LERFARPGSFASLLAIAAHTSLFVVLPIATDFVRSTNDATGQLRTSIDVIALPMHWPSPFWWMTHRFAYDFSNPKPD
jgi:hypothetical protein